MFLGDLGYDMADISTVSPLILSAQQSMRNIRTMNWTGPEIEVLRELCTKNSHILHGGLSAYITADKKNKLWSDINDKINAVGGNRRSIDQSKKKWKNVRANAVATVRKYTSTIKKTGKTYGGLFNRPYIRVDQQF